MDDSLDVQSLPEEVKNVTTFRRENYSLTWRIAQFGECINRKYEFCSPTYCPTSEPEACWKMMLFSTDVYPEGKHVALRLIKTKDNENHYSVMYAISIIDGNGEYHLMKNREKVFRHCLDFDECSVIDNRKLKEKNLLSNGFLTIYCRMDVLIPENPEHSSGRTSSPADISSVSEISRCKMPKAFDKNTSEGLFQINKGNFSNDSSYYNTSQSLEFLSADFKSLYLNRQDCDIIIRVSDGELQAHKAVLIARSDYFRQACVNQRGSFRNPEIYISEIRSIIMEFVLYYLYTGQLRQITFEMAMEILVVCEKLKLSQLEEMIQNFLKSQINANNVIDLFKMSMHLKINTLKNNALKFMSSNYEEVSKTEKWKEMIQSEPRAAGEVLLTVASFKRNVNYMK